VSPEDKKPYEPQLAAVTVAEHVADFTNAVVERLHAINDRDGRPGLVVAAYDTELFGHWWHEGPAWLLGVLDALPAAGVRVTTLRGALAAGHLGPPVDLPASSWGSGKDWRVWDGEQVADLVDAGASVQRELLSTVDAHVGPLRDPLADELAREALLALSSDWAFMVTKNSAADYARRRATDHGARFTALAAALRAGNRTGTTRSQPFGHLDARGLRKDGDR
jgi:1,4-alpha-glucan branching enzyme